MSNKSLPAKSHFEFTNKWFEITAKSIWDDLIPKIKPTKILEIGSFEGASACYLIAHCASERSIEMHCVDTWEGGVEHKAAGTEMTEVERRFLTNTKIACEQARHAVELRIHKGPSNICLAKMIGQGLLNHFDLVYIDGSHQAPDVLSDAILSFPLLRVDGTMIFDDYLFRSSRGDPLDGPKIAVDVFLNIFFYKMRINWSPNSQVIARKTSD